MYCHNKLDLILNYASIFMKVKSSLLNTFEKYWKYTEIVDIQILQKHLLSVVPTIAVKHFTKFLF